jgi:aminoglycoside 6'-N-acetyltransferase
VDEICRDGELAIRRMRDDDADFDLIAAWRARPHVHEWWDPDDPPPTVEEVAEHYGPRAGDAATTACIIELAGRPIGYVQFYRWAAYPEESEAIDVVYRDDTFGVDIFIGEPDLVGIGIGSRAVDALCRYLFEEMGASDVMLTTEVTNLRAQRAYEKAGFVKERRVLDLDTRGGERVESWLMRREADR